jgi:hypothetical protein
MYYRDIAADYAPSGGISMVGIILLLVLIVGGYFAYTHWIKPSAAHGLAYYQPGEMQEYETTYPAYTV